MPAMAMTTSQATGTATGTSDDRTEPGGLNRVAAEPLIRLEQVTVRQGSGPSILTDIGFAVPAGALQTIVGPHGSGKSTLCSLLTQLKPPDRGRLLIFDRDVAELKENDRAPLRRRLGIIAQQPHLLDHLSVLDNVLLPFAVRAQFDEQRCRDAEELLRWIGLGARLSVPARLLSQGERQCTAIARALVCRPSLVVADEPFALLDGTASERITHLLLELNRLGITLLITGRDWLPALDPSPLFLSGGALQPLAAASERRP